MALFHSYILPWTSIPEEDERLKRNVLIALVLSVIFGIVMPFLPVPKKDKNQVEELPPRLAQLVVQKQKPPPPPPPKKPEKKKPEEKKPEKKKPEKKKPEKKEPKPKPKPKVKTQAELVDEARKKAKSTGLLAMSDMLSDLRETPVAPKLGKSNKLSKGAATAKTFKRNVLTSGISSGSGGINTSNLSTGVGRSSLAGRQTTVVDSPVEKVAKTAKVQRDASSKRPDRTYEEVSLVFDRNKGAIYSLYNRELRKNPGIEGKVVLEITIAPDGSVVAVKIVSSELNSPALERKLISRIKLFNFGAKNVETLIVTYPIDFLPP